MSKTKIEWCDETINPLVSPQGGWHCTKIASGCKNCYAERINILRGNGIPYDNRNTLYNLNLEPFRRLPKKPCRVFVQSMSDIFHFDVAHSQLKKIFTEMYFLTQHTFIISTKRPARADMHIRWCEDVLLENLYMLFSTSTQKELKEGIKVFLQVPVKLHGLNLEPLLEPIDCRPYLGGEEEIAWVIVGPETGIDRRECKIEWIENIVEQCRKADVPCFVKALPIKGRISRNPEEWPVHLRVREFPEIK